MSTQLKFIIIIAVVIILILLCVFLYIQNNDIVVTKYSLKINKLSKATESFKIVQISDLHNKDFGEKFIEIVSQQNPDIIAITGDLFDRRHTDLDVALNTAKALTKIAPTYYITGNHEGLSPQSDDFIKQLQQTEVIMLLDQKITIEKGDVRFNLIGVQDPAYTQDEETYLETDNAPYMREKLKSLEIKQDEVNVLLSHRPELFSVYVEMGLDIVLTGHAHGGQIRVPIIGGLYSPNQGIFPKYTSGMFTQNQTNMIVSRGLGNSAFPFRVFNRPEIVVLQI